MTWVDDTLVALLTLGARRPFLIRPETGRPVIDPDDALRDAIDIAPDSGDLLVMGLDELVREGRTAMMTVVVHARWTGQAARAAALRAIFDHAASAPGVAFMRRDDIARWWLEQYPPSAG
jgi:hypothetical protein